MNAEPFGQQVLDVTDTLTLASDIACDEHNWALKAPVVPYRAKQPAGTESSGPKPTWDTAGRRSSSTDSNPVSCGLSPWSSSAAKRFFDCFCVILTMPIALPMILVIAIAVRLTSQGPVFFLQRRMGRHGKLFTIVKFRTMIHVANKAHHPITTSDNQRFTLIGPFLRRWKLDELPQLANVLIGDMSLVGPRPKMQEHVNTNLECRPGITGMATSVFACEEAVLARLPRTHLDVYYHSVVLPAKWQLDAEYMAQATFLSDLRLLVNSVLRRFDTSLLEELIVAAALELENSKAQYKPSEISRPIPRVPVRASNSQVAGVERASAF